MFCNHRLETVFFFLHFPAESVEVWLRPWEGQRGERIKGMKRTVGRGGVLQILITTLWRTLIVACFALGATIVFLPRRLRHARRCRLLRASFEEA